MLNSDFSFQLFGFVVSIAGGVILGACYDVLRIWRVFLHTPRRAMFFQDFFYMVFAAFFTFLLALAVSSGEIRLYILAGEIIGWFVYYYTVGQVTAWLFRLISNFLYRFLFYPLSRVFGKFSGHISKKLQVFSKYVKKFTAKLKKCLKHHSNVVYNYRNGSKSVKRRKDALMYESHKKTKA